MTPHVQDTATNRFRTWWAALFTVLSFTIVLGVVLLAAGGTVASPEMSGTSVEELTEEGEALQKKGATLSRPMERALNRKEVTEAQEQLISQAKLVDDGKNTISLPVDSVLPFGTSLLKSGQTKSDVPVPVAAPPAPPAEESADGESAEPSDAEAEETK